MTPSIAVVTKRAGLALTMNSPTHHFVEVRPIAGWQTRTWSEDAVVLDLGTAESTLSAIETLTAAGVEAPVIVVATDSDGWDELLRLYPDLSLVSLPIMPASMLSAVDRAVRQARRSRPAPAAEPVEPVEAVDPEPAGAATTAAEPAPDEPAAPAGPVPRQAEPTPVTSSPAAVAAEAGAPAAVEPTAPPRPKRSQRGKPRERGARTTGPPPAAPEPRTAPPPEPATPRHRVGAPRQSLMTLVHGLSREASRLTRVHEVAEVVRRRCAGAVPCAASAVLVPDGGVWRVSAGEHLRPLEERLQLGSDHWLVTEVATAKHGLLVTDTDIARSKLSGSPLVSWPNLLALPVEEVGAIVLLARDGKGFGKGDLTRVRGALGDGGSQLLDAVDVRDLARKLSGFVDRVD